MSRIGKKFKELQGKKEKALILYLTAGDPSLAGTEEIIPCLERAGADILEIGVPFSDPTADGPVIQEAAQRSLRGGTNLAAILAMIARLRRQIEIPVVLFTYYNPVFAYGNERFAEDAEAAGVDGLLVVDLPPEEAGELREFTDPRGLDFITLVAPTTDDRRLEKIVRNAGGFIYYISVTGVTGTKTPVAASVTPDLLRIRQRTDLPVAVGFGISTPAQVRSFAADADGVVIGSALVKWLAEHGGSPDLMSRLTVYVRGLKAATG
ncbi:MAG TPA: tryptophan synthase subunit alpha [Syntrophales bacterium]|jgi:tryptophan synthase alpha chain|nr:tryptophan synthase subunit alpha [Syntrophales bacterium]HOU77655.1 tryptophan synthase subunit alpha [Syntrophales bacterium]HPC32007.1 tryptophan synthase subunit alpha [Syntrophales bacterium]HQG35021.1 tryptophan synthase subunit alpha [Syntrophales bacterium]HQI36812.1 tryptophan synthase subunit alpha [Syntrophales bacterium]